jgi:glycosyl transferase family 25
MSHAKPNLNHVNDKFIDAIIYINLDHRIDRKASIERQLSIFSPGKCSRFPGIYQPVSGFIGCAQSHIRVLEIAIENNYRNVLIVEDDMLWNNIEDNYCVFQYLATTKKYDVIVLGGSNATYDKDTLNVTQVEAPVAYLVNNHYFKTLLENYKKGLEIITTFHYPQAFCLDQYWKSLQPTGNWFIVRPCLSYQGNDFSDIENTFVNLAQNYISEEKLVSVNSATTLSDFFTLQTINLYVRLFDSNLHSSIVPNLDSFCQSHEFNISTVTQKEFESFKLIFQKCVIDILSLDFSLNEDTLSIFSPLFTKTRYILVPSIQPYNSLLNSKWSIFQHFDTYTLLKNNVFN